MQAEEKIVYQLGEKFNSLKDKFVVQKQKRIFSEFLTREEFEQVLPYVRDELGFYRASHVVGTDEGDDLGFILSLANDEGIIFALKQKAPKSDPKINSCPGLTLPWSFTSGSWKACSAHLSRVCPPASHILPDGWPEGNILAQGMEPDYFDQNT